VLFSKNSFSWELISSAGVGQDTQGFQGRHPWLGELWKKTNSSAIPSAQGEKEKFWAFGCARFSA
jgi:hypothetical protein